MEDTLRSFETARRIGQPRADVYRLIGMAHGLAGRPREAFEAWRRASEIEPDDVVSRYEVARYAMEYSADFLSWLPNLG